MEVCPFCGSAIPEITPFCPYCGRPLSTSHHPLAPLPVTEAQMDMAVNFFERSLKFVQERGYSGEIKVIKERRWAEMNPEFLLEQYVLVVLSSGWEYNSAERLCRRFFESGRDLNLIHHPKKRLAIEKALKNYLDWYDDLQELADSNRRLMYLDQLPMIGKVTRYHLARNLGMDVAKPDRHMVRLTKHFGFMDPEQMCLFISGRVPFRVGVIDYVLWRASSLGLRP